MSETAVVESVPEKGNEFKQKVLLKMAELKDQAFSAGTFADIFGATEIFGTAVLADVVLNTHVTSVTMDNPDRLIGALLIIGGEAFRRKLGAIRQNSSQIANNLMAQLILDEVRENKE